MLTALLLHLIRVSSALPLTGEHPETDPSDNCVEVVRTVPGIVWSCLTTIFACTWIAVHPNVVNPDKRTWWGRFRGRFWIFVIALIVPEYIVAWAVGQYSQSSVAVKRLREFDPCKDWTLTHGFFLTMGGFELADTDGKWLGVLDEPSLVALLRKNRVVLPPIPPSDIDEKNRSDALGKLLAVIQTTWFVGQVISRQIQKLPMTELELTTAAFALLNIITYILWWKKPLDVKRPIVLTLFNAFGSLTPSKSMSVPPKGGTTSRIFIAISAADQMDEGSTWLYIDLDGSGEWGSSGDPLQTPGRCVRLASRISTFHRGPSESADHRWGQFWAEILLGILFGAIHCIAWTYKFPTTGERELWRVISMYITLAPALLLLVQGLAVAYRSEGIVWWFGGGHKEANAIWTSRVGGLLVILFIVARITTFACAFAVLRDVPPSTLQSVQWTRFIPHV
ncbi:hypothetical protein C8R46DRAFT_1352738 [Mycena filopes]|nr:hypothetical protein C8R46DRAFT_1352738 [Mycena filopes]